jgi:hypothetical protein
LIDLLKPECSCLLIKDGICILDMIWYYLVLTRSTLNHT